jgi:hypothetical protein
MATHKAISNQQSLVQNEARLGKERCMETYNLTEPNNNQQHTIRTMTSPFTNTACSCTRMPSAEYLVRAASRPGSSRNPCVQCGGPLQRCPYETGNGIAPQTASGTHWRNQTARWCPGWGKAASVASQRNCMAPYDLDSVEGWTIGYPHDINMRTV